jgi:dipeptidyl aminopeptidase/acylaminoacyl peptidase
VQVAPGGASVALTVTEADAEANQFHTALYVWEDGGGAKDITPGFADVHAPRWSADGALLSFLSAGSSADPDGMPQVWLLGLPGRDEPARLSDLPGGVIDYGWGPDGSIYALTRSESGGEREFWRISVPDGTAEYVWGGDAGIREMAVSPDGGSIVFSTNGTGAIDDYLNYNLRILDLESRRSRELTSRPGSEVSPVWSPDSRTIVFRAPQNPRYPYSQAELYSVPAGGGTPNSLTDSFDRAVVGHVWPAGGDLLFTAAVGARTQIFVARANGAIEAVTRGDYNFGSFDAAPIGGAVYAVRQSATEAAELWRIGGSSVERLTELNAPARRWKLGRQEVIEWTAPDGLSIEGVLVYPADYEEGRRYPLLVNLAGGPLGRATNVIEQPGVYQLFATRGYAVLAPNFRGSVGYGEGFATANREDLAGGDLVDVMTGIDHVIGLGVADPDRLAVYGGAGSPYGAYMTAWAITQTPRFDAAIASYGAPARSSARPGSRAGPSERELFDAGYLDVLERDRSPLEAVRTVQTPLLIVEWDSQTLFSRSQRLYRALSDLGRTVEYLEIIADHPSAPSPQSLTDLFFRRLRWFDKYLKFGGADLFDFYLVGEWVPGPGGWRMLVEHADPRADYSGLQPDSGRYLEMTIILEPTDQAVADGTMQALHLDPSDAISLLGPDGGTQPFAGTATELFGRETLIMGSLGAITIPVPESGAPAALTVRLAFEVPDEAGEYRLRIIGFVPVRIWVPAASQESRRTP